MQNAYCDLCLGRTQCYDWFMCFKDGRTLVDDNSRSEPPSTSNDPAYMTAVYAIVRSNRQFNCRGNCGNSEQFG